MRISKKQSRAGPLLKTMATALVAAVFLMTPHVISQDRESVRVALTASKIFTGDGKCIQNGYVLLKGSKVESVVPAGTVLSDNVEIREYDDAVICPGLIDLCTAHGAQNDRSEPASAVQPELRMADVFDAHHQDFDKALRCGTTTVLLAPSAENVIGGCAAAVKTWGKKRDNRMLCSCGPVFMTVSNSCFKSTRLPTSRIGASDLFRRILDQAARPDQKDSSDILARLVRGKTPGFFVADEAHDILSGIELAGRHGIDMAILGGSEALKVVDSLKGKGIPLVFGPFDLSTPEAVLRAPAAVCKAGVPIAFASKSPGKSPAFLRLTAALAVKGGLDTGEALKALTSGAAETAGLSKRVGTLASGMDADIAVFSSHPADMEARLIVVYVDGKEAWTRKGELK